MKQILNKLPITKLKIYIARILYYMITPIYGRRKRIINRRGINYEVDLSEGIDLSLFLFGRFQQHVIQSTYLKVPKDAVIIDVGANFGIMSLQFAQLASQGEVYACEPTHYAMEKLKKNLLLNPELSKRIQPFHTFISAKTSENVNIKAFSSWKVGGGNNTSSEIHPVHMGTAHSTDGVGAISLDDFCEMRQLTRLDFVKIDTDGHEFEVMQGASRTFAKFRPYIIFEIGMYVMTEKGIDFSFYSNLFGELNYTLVDSATGKEITLNNHHYHIPAKGTIDILAIPR